MNGAHAIRCDRISELSSPLLLGTILGPVESVTPESMGTAGFSGSTHTRLRIALRDGRATSLVLKHTGLAADWTAYRTGDASGREAMLLAAPALGDVWRVFVSPHRGYAIEPGEVGLLMEDLGPHLFPDVREPLTVGAEDALLSALARMHAAFWDSPVLAQPWLAREADLISLLGPLVLAGDSKPALPAPLGERVAEGWREAFRLLPELTARLLRRPASEHERAHADLPHTLVHGDAKVANFAVLPDGVAAFDWALAARAPATVDLGWYLAINASRLARTRDEVIARYRGFLEGALGGSVDDRTWSRLLDVAILVGARMLLWNKALAVRDGRAGALEEWDWWVERLRALDSSRA